jgi:tetratricopeptide (TPR) repeat protein
MGLALINLRQYGEAIEHFRRALETSPDFPDAHNSLGIALASSGQLAPALEHFQTAIRFRGDYFEAYDNLSRTLAAAGRAAEAASALRRAIAIANTTGNTAAAARLQTSLDAIERGQQPSR